MFGVSRQAIAKWRVHGVPDDRLVALADLDAATDVLLRYVRPERIPAVVTFLVAASGLTAWGIGAAFWALLAGLAVHLALRARL